MTYFLKNTSIRRLAHTSSDDELWELIHLDMFELITEFEYQALQAEGWS